MKEKVPLCFQEKFQEIVKNVPLFTENNSTLIHTDIGLHNALIDKTGKIFFIDWDDVGNGNSLFDSAYPLLSQFLDFIDNNFIFKEQEVSAFYFTYYVKFKGKNNSSACTFDISLFFLLLYIEFGDIDKNCQKILYALENRSYFENFLDEAMKNATD